MTLPWAAGSQIFFSSATVMHSPMKPFFGLTATVSASKAIGSS
jgi:hypothetical protein